MSKLIQTMYELLLQGESVVTATVVNNSGRTRLAGAKMLIRPNGNSHGTIGGGLLEAEALKIAAGMFTSGSNQIQILEFTGEITGNIFAPCGKGTQVFIEYIAASPGNIRLFQKLLAVLQKGLRCCLITPFCKDDDQQHNVIRGLVCEDGSLCGKVPCPDKWLSTLLERISAITSPVLEYVENHRLFIDPWQVPNTVYLFGAGHVAQEVAELTGKAGFRTIVLDDREKFSNQKRFPMADDVVVLSSFENCINGLVINDESYLVIVTRGHRYDKIVLRQALRTHAGYIGIIGSVRKRDVVFKALLDEGFSIDDLLRVYFPIGINIHAETPVEIAVSIVSQLILIRAKKMAAKKQQLKQSLAQEAVQVVNR